MDESFALELEEIQWFHACGKSVEASLPFGAEQVQSWNQAIANCSDPSWENTTLEARNRLTVFLHSRHRDEYQQWNAVTIAAKSRIVTPLTNRVWRPFAENGGLGKVFVGCVTWDVLGAVMEHEYGRLPERPEFFLQLLRTYRAGHFPGGWIGDWPDGKQLVW
ncbi:MAG TPA: hypothetical protein VHR72_02585 [Gemmataceae bacterium]|jgi:hypothetical protein|nr:hypothetical protein [Gemmataceae bacterium]